MQCLWRTYQFDRPIRRIDTAVPHCQRTTHGDRHRNSRGVPDRDAHDTTHRHTDRITAADGHAYSHGDTRSNT